MQPLQCSTRNAICSNNPNTQCADYTVSPHNLPKRTAHLWRAVAGIVFVYCSEHSSYATWYPREFGLCPHFESASDLPSVTSLVTLFLFCLRCRLVGLYPVFGIAQGLRPSSVRYYALRCNHHSTISCKRCSAVCARSSAATIPTHNEPTTHNERRDYPYEAIPSLINTGYY